MEWGKLSTNLPWADAFEGGGGGGEMPCLFITEKKRGKHHRCNKK